MNLSWEKFLADLQTNVLYLVGPFLAADSTPYGEPVVFVDRGARYRHSGMGISVGDGDSHEGELDVLLPQEKDFSDLAFILRSLPQQIIKIYLFGFLGGRRDHELANLGEVYQFLAARNFPAQAAFDQKIMGYSAGSWELEVHGLFSILVLEPTKIFLRGNCKYTLLEPTLIQPLSSHGLSNEGQGTIGIHADRPFFLCKN